MRAWQQKLPSKKAPSKRSSRRPFVDTMPAKPDTQPPAATTARLAPWIIARIEAKHERVARVTAEAEHAQTKVELEKALLRELVAETVALHLPPGAKLTHMDTSTGQVQYTVPTPDLA